MPISLRLVKLYTNRLNVKNVGTLATIETKGKRLPGTNDHWPMTNDRLTANTESFLITLDHVLEIIVFFLVIFRHWEALVSWWAGELLRSCQFKGKSWQSCFMHGIGLIVLVSLSLGISADTECHPSSRLMLTKLFGDHRWCIAPFCNAE